MARTRKYPARIVSGGQTGVDRSALDVALALGIDCGGWCPRGRRAEDGRLDDRYPLLETPTADYAERTEWNVRDSDGTLVLLQGAPSGGTALTITLARRLGKKCRVVDLDEPLDLGSVRAWLRRHRIAVLNVAGPRESGCRGIGGRAVKFLQALLG